MLNNKFLASAVIGAGLALTSPANAQRAVDPDFPVVTTPTNPTVTTPTVTTPVVNPNEPAPRCTGCTEPPTEPRTPRTRTPHETTNNVRNRNDVRINVLKPSDMVAANNWCTETLSGVIGVGTGPAMGTLGLTKAQFAEACGRWYTMYRGAENPNCVVSTTSVLVAGGADFRPAVDASRQACFAQPSRRAPRLRN